MAQETIGKTWETIVNMGYDGIGNYRKNIGKTQETMVNMGYDGIGNIGNYRKNIGTIGI